MKQLLVFTCCLLLSGASVRFCSTSDQQNGSSIANIPAANNIVAQDLLPSVAWQVAPPVTPIEERKSTNWLWWAVGVALGIGGGVLLYFLIKKDPRQDVH